MSDILIKKVKQGKNNNHIKPILITGFLFLIIVTYSGFLTVKFVSLWFGGKTSGKETVTQILSNGEAIQIKYLTPNKFSRPGTKLKSVRGIVIHYTANPGTSADNNRSYFEGLKNTKATYASSHFIIGLDGEILQCIPLNEISYASNNRNKDTISIECCHPDKTGEFNEKTYASLVSLTAALCSEYNLKEEDILRHYDVNGKLCPLYYAEHETAWETFKDDVMKDADHLKQSGKNKHH